MEAFELFEEAKETFEPVEALDVERFRLAIGEVCGGEVEVGEAGRGGETLLHRDVGGLGQNLEMLSVLQAGILPAVRLDRVGGRRWKTPWHE